MDLFSQTRTAASGLSAARSMSKAGIRSSLFVMISGQSCWTCGDRRLRQLAGIARRTTLQFFFPSDLVGGLAARGLGRPPGHRSSHRADHDGHAR